jgi:Zn finger protein HypA/HybF involved in hydrogenase expression
VSLSLVKARKSSYLDVNAALYAICSTGKGRCWHCDQKLPAAEEAIDVGWHVQRVEGERVASIILICPKCRRKRAKVSEKRFLPNLSPPVCNAILVSAWSGPGVWGRVHPSP